MVRETFTSRHVGPNEADKKEMLAAIGVNSLDQLIEETIPANIRLKKPLNVSKPISEYEYLNNLKLIAAKNKTYKSFIGQGYYGTIIPPVIQRNILENPGWYTAYTPYQAEISQGRLEGLLNFQTMVSDLTGMEIANASLLDEGTAAAEAMLMLHGSRKGAQKKNNASTFLVADTVYTQTQDVIVGRANNMGINVSVKNPFTTELTDDIFAILVQYPNGNGSVEDYKNLAETCKEKGIFVAVASDLMALTLLTPPGEWGADVVVGNSQRFGVPMGYGGPHAAFFATHESYKRNLPGRIIGVSKDSAGNQALRMALQTREQHIRRDKATSNICTAQALLAIMAGMYAVYHGPNGLRNIAELIHAKAKYVSDALEQVGFINLNNFYFDTLCLQLPVALPLENVLAACEANEVNVWKNEQGHLIIALDEASTPTNITQLLTALYSATGNTFTEVTNSDFIFTKEKIGLNLRKSRFLTNPIFHKFHSETEMMRYLKRLENKDISLTHHMIPLGSCTMKLNAAAELMPITWPEFAHIHPFTPKNQTQGYQQIFLELEKDLADITGFAGMSLQPNSGAQGEYAGLMVMKAYHEANGQGQRNIVLIPSSAHGTNPASAVMAGLKVVVTKCDDQGNIDIADLKEKAALHANELCGLMVTYPSTHGVFEEGIIEITDTIHEYGGQVYMDGANMNAQVGLTSPGNIGADVCHLNLHKTFAIPHGGGGPGMGPIGVAAHLVPFLPGHSIVETGGEKALNAVSAAPWGSALILLISYAYIKMLGVEGLTESTRAAILNANYLKAKLEKDYPVLFSGANNRVAHEMILDLRPFKAFGVEAEDVAKRLIDYGFHSPTLSFPVAGTIMIEPTESESIDELDRFAEAMLGIRKEIAEIENGEYTQEENVLKHAPFTAKQVVSSNWEFSFSREKAAFPAAYIDESKYWPPVKRVDNAFGDRNLICSCPSIESYQEEALA